MAWYHQDEVRELGLEAEGLLFYVDPYQRRWLWVEEEAPQNEVLVDVQRAEIAQLRKELRERAVPVRPRLQVSRPVFSPPATLPQHGLAGRVLALLAQRWSGSERELERQAGLPKAFLAKAKKGQRSGPRSAASWTRLEEFLNESAFIRAA